MNSLENLIKSAALILKKKDILSYNLDAEILLAQTLNENREHLFKNLNKKINNDKIKKFNYFIKRRELKEPIAYIIKKKDFWKNTFLVDKHVLIPRPDTEIVVEEILRIFKHTNKLNILEIGVGTGCIIISLLKEKKILKA